MLSADLSPCKRRPGGFFFDPLSDQTLQPRTPFYRLTESTLTTAVFTPWLLPMHIQLYILQFRIYKIQCQYLTWIHIHKRYLSVILSSTRDRYKSNNRSSVDKISRLHVITRTGTPLIQAPDTHPKKTEHKPDSPPPSEQAIEKGLHSESKSRSVKEEAQNE